ncbi:terminase small subunit [Coprococcus sp. AF19-8AC]|uniref:terminase small subunit n=1 Tax=Coprococcus sp. AF19-8AC TaxID=2293090 RepID=UPI000E71C837|nr:terminase small subunit [Coprococcus sp. AF19-8AC]RJV45965.1 terminase small subunit [Coprococcus sp. AF19-8AC]
MAKLTAKQQRFCDEYLIDLNATQAAIRAGYSKRSARQIADLNMSKHDIREYIDNRLAEKEKALIADQNEVLKYLTATMRREKKECIVVTTSEERSMYAPDDNGTMRKQTVKKETPQIVEIPARLSDANKAAELLGKAYGLYTDKVEADVDMDLNININYGDDDDTGGGGAD